MKIINLLLLLLFCSSYNSYNINSIINESVNYILNDSLFNEFTKLDSISEFYIEEDELISISTLYLTEHSLFNKEFRFLLDTTLTDEENLYKLIKLENTKSCNLKIDFTKIIYFTNDTNSNFYLYYDYNCILSTLCIRVNFLNIYSESINIEYLFKFIENKPLVLYRYRLY